MKSYCLTKEICTAQNTTHRLSSLSGTEPCPALPSTDQFIFIDPDVRFQEIVGFGGAFTEAASSTLDRVSDSLRSEALKAYFSKDDGHGYTLCRTHINSCDFSLGNYAYSETDGDVALNDFSIERDYQSLIPMIQEAQTIAGQPFRLFASPWSPPAWMKTTEKMNQGGKLKPEYRQAWADYYVRYIQEYAKAGIPIWGLTVQNEPEATQTWDSCTYTGEEERDFVKYFLGPALHQANMQEVKLMIWDHNRDRMYERAKTVLDDPDAAKYVWGVGFHWYDRRAFQNVGLVHDAYPDKQLVFTEGCQEGGPHIGSWALGERYAESMINDLNNWTVGWVDWNLVLDETGGPNHVGNLCSAPIIVDTEQQKLIYQSSYYYIGHFSRYIRPGAQRIVCGSSQKFLETTGFLNPDGNIAVVVLNRTDEERPFTLRIGELEAPNAMPPHSIKTFIIESA